MKKLFRKLVKKLFMIDFILIKIIKQLYYRREEINTWKKKGKPIPTPHIIKQQTIRYYQKKYNVKLFVETGTYLGDMVNAQKYIFKRLYSIELGYNLWKNANEKFSKYQHINILHGDSGQVLNEVVPQLDQKTIFWLDGHYSAGITAKGDKECPIFEELHAILSSDLNHILLIDDARCFNGAGDYPTILELKNYILSKKPLSIIEVKDDMIIVTLR